MLDTTNTKNTQNSESSKGNLDEFELFTKQPKITYAQFLRTLNQYHQDLSYLEFTKEELEGFLNRNLELTKDGFELEELAPMLDDDWDDVSESVRKKVKPEDDVLPF